MIGGKTRDQVLPVLEELWVLCDWHEEPLDRRGVRSSLPSGRIPPMAADTDGTEGRTATRRLQQQPRLKSAGSNGSGGMWSDADIL